MDGFELKEEHKTFKKVIRDFAEKEIAPLVGKAEEKEEFPLELFPKMGKLGFLCVTYPEKYGGAGADTITASIFCEEVGRISAGICSALMVQSLLATSLIYEYGTEEQKEKYLVPAIKGKKIGAFGLTESNAGSDVSAIETVASHNGEGYTLNGTKMFITNGPIADYVIVAAYTDKSEGRKGMSVFIVDKGAPGFYVAKKMAKMGILCSETGELVFDGCWIPKENLIGEEGKGFEMIMGSLDAGRILVGSRAVGIAQAAYESSLKYAKERVQFGRPIGKFQITKFKIADMVTEIEAARLLVYRAAWLRDQGRRISKEASMAKLFATEMAVRVTGEALQIHGGYGYTKEYPIERYFRDAKLGTISEGTSEIQHLIIAREVGLD